jgi:hypothetical protein
MPYHPEHELSFQSILRHTVPILHRYNSDLGMGSGVLVDIQDHRFVATAFHCLDQAVLLTEGMVIPKDGSFPSPRIAILNSDGDNQVDIGFLEIDRHAVIKTAGDHYPCTLKQLYIGNQIPPDSIIHVVGFPWYGTKQLGPDDIERSLEGLMVKFLDADRTFLRFQFSGSAGKWNESGEWITKATQSPHGFSGGGCWAITKAKDTELYAPTKTTKLLAIQSEWDSIRVCKAPLISEWVRLISTHYPKLREFMLSELGSSSPSILA